VAVDLEAARRRLETATIPSTVTTWNEWVEHTAIEPGEKDGTLMLDRTRFWTAEFKRRTSDVEPRDLARMSEVVGGDSVRRGEGLLIVICPCLVRQVVAP
jgi:hypothetical protein